ncbi:MAG: hypothetical protein ACX932_03365 [Gammaproteobacteria bacterium]
MDVPSLAQMLINIQQTIPALMSMVTGAAYVMGFFFIFSAFYNMKQYGEMRLMSSANTDLRGPIGGLLLGAALIYIPNVFSVALITFFGSDNPIAYEGNGSNWDLLAESLIDVIQFVGVIAIIKAIVLFRKASSGGSAGQQGLAGRGVTHFIGGVLAINIIGTKNILFSTLGF